MIISSHKRIVDRIKRRNYFYVMKPECHSPFESRMVRGRGDLMKLLENLLILLLIPDSTRGKFKAPLSPMLAQY